jgi:lambda family phage portal protein
VRAPVKPSWLDKMATAISPSWGATRLRNKIQISAYQAAGYVVPGSRKKSMKGVDARPLSADADVSPKLDGMRALSRDLYMSSPLASAILKRHRTLSIGSGLQLQSVIDRDFLGLEAGAAEAAEREIEREFDLWGESYNSDFDGCNFFGDNQALGFFNLLLNGDFFYMPVWRPAPEAGFPYELTVKLIDADLVRDPLSEYLDRDISGGIEKDGDGRTVAAHVWDSYPYENTVGRRFGKSIRVPFFDDQGRQQLFHVFDPDRISQRRGVPLLANVADSLKQLTRLSEAELMAALVSSFFTVFVKDSSGFMPMMGQALTPEETVTGGGRYDPTGPPVEAKNLEDGNDLEMGYGNVTYLDDRKDIEIADPGRTDKNFDAFWKSLSTQISAGANQPIEQTLMRYETSYTAARAAANDVWQYRKVARTLMSRRFCQPIFMEFMAEAVMKGRLRAPGFFEDYATRRAWTRSSWIGAGRGYLDPLKESKAAAEDLKNYLTTHEAEFIQKSGGRWDAAMEARARENRKLEELDLISTPAEPDTEPEEPVVPEEPDVDTDAEDMEEELNEALG